MSSAESHRYSRKIVRMVESSMSPFTPHLRTLLAIIGLPVLACLLAIGIGASFPLTTTLVAVAATCAAWIATRQTTQAEQPPIASHTPAPSVVETDTKLRHDIRGIISPAMLAAEQLSLNKEPAVQKAAGTINDSLDRLTARLKQRPTH